ncbi:FAD-binding oxidoreductase [Pseudomonas sp. JH-2]|uniref:NAD(P)/FAD-dependent oxidoreductase n=1 Tax=Pseudomonas sp. JH-2 TaxID=3114998 RepID=UPI002E26F989|nr:FAD-binding oxidoreductase [Pseudomonas sp. JH-2]
MNRITPLRRFFHGGALEHGVSRAAPVPDAGMLPRECDVVVIGGGFIGCFTALALAERGLRVTLCEKGVIAGEASGRSIGWIDSQYLSPRKMELIDCSKRLWERMDERIGASTGYRRCGLLSLFKSPDDADAARQWLASVQGLPGVDAYLVDAREAASLLPAGADTRHGGLYQPSDACAEPTLAAPAVALAAGRLGANVLQHCAVRGIECQAGRVSAVHTERGRIAAQAVVLAGGAWSPLLARRLGLPLPQLMAFGSAQRIRPAVAGPDTSAWLAQGIYRANGDGSYTVGAVNGAAPLTPTTLRHLWQMLPAIRQMWSQVDPVFSLDTFLHDLKHLRGWPLDGPSPFERCRILQPETRHGVLRETLGQLQAHYPLFADARVEETWAGALVSTPDNMPVISGVERMPGLFLGTGFYYGLTMGPAAGQALADLVSGRTPEFDVHPYRHERFVDGSALQFQA